MINWNNFDTLNSYKKLLSLNCKVELAKVLNPQRVKSCSVPMAKGLVYNYAAKQVNEQILSVLQELADEQQLIEKYQLLLNGEVINTGEKRKVLHHLARGQLGTEVIHEGRNLGTFYSEQLKKIESFVKKVHVGEITGAKGDKFSSIVQIGIGGSDLGPRALYLALDNWAVKNNRKLLNASFISNVDPDDAFAVLGGTELAKTLFILVSKSGTTQETLANESLVKQALVKAGLDPSKHMVAVTSETSPLAKNDGYLASFFMDDFIGGRYSSSSPVGGVALSLAFGFNTFNEFLQGAHEADALSLEKSIMKNPALLDALIGVYERNILGYPVTAILPYSQALSRFPAHLQQADMESNGKQVNRRGEPISYATGPVLFGEPGTNGQHSFYQLLHQGTDVIPLQFIGFTRSQTGFDVEVDGSTSQKKLCANLVAQIVAFATGKSDTDTNKNFPGERPSSVIKGTELSPEVLGSLLAHYENKIMFQGFVWNINSFDQEGVQLGKVLTKKVLAGDMDPTLKAFSDFFEV